MVGPVRATTIDFLLPAGPVFYFIFFIFLFLGLGHTKLMFRITDFSGYCLGGEGGIKIKLNERRLRSMQNQNHFIVNIRHTVMGPDSNV